MNKERKNVKPYPVEEEKICSGSLNKKEWQKLKEKNKGSYPEGEEIVIGFKGDDYDRCV